MVGALLSSVAWGVPGMQAQAGDLPVKAPAVAPVPFWWFHGEVEAGGRFFLNDPNRNGSNYRGQSSLAKYYEYSDIKPGPFSNIWLSTGTSDGVYQIDLGGKNIGYNDQRYWLDASKAGEHYFNFLWDQDPHLRSTSAQTFYQGVGTTNLTLPPGFVKSNGAAIPAAINPYLYQTDLGIKRDTASAHYRWTPDDAWDIKADYSHLHRSGTQVDGVVGFGGGFPYGPVEVPRPVDDTTQNYGLNGEYAGTSPWGKKFNFKIAYNGSQYDDAFTRYIIADPNNLGVAQPNAQMSTWPSNRADAVSGMLGADLPWKSRYAGNVGYTMMKQDDAFIPMSLNAAYTLPQNSLDGKINTLLSNNVITTQITPELTSKLNYRYYNFDNGSPEILFNNLIHYDNTAGGGENYRTIAISYTKQNAGADLNWRPDRTWNIGAGYGWERYDWTRADADVTNENTGKVHVDWKPMSWFGVRTSALYGVRRYNNYDYQQFVANIMYPAGGGYSTAYRQFYLDNRDRFKANASVDLMLLHNLLLTPTFKYQDDHYGLDKYTESGLADSRSYSAGLDATYMFSPGTSITVGYMREYYTQLVGNCNCDTHSDPTGIPTPAKYLETNDRITVDTVTALARYAAIPDVLDLSLRYALSRGVDHQQVNAQYSANPLTGGQFPDVTTWFQRLDATAVYTFDKEAVAMLGWKGKVKAKVHYAWERNAVTNWQIDTVAPYDPGFASGANAIFMAWDNPNYNVHMLMGSLSFLW
jgi:MtrB/PioB family decaheme-associated outer membrane protein